MKITVKKELIIERERTLTIKLGKSSCETFCAVCCERVKFITVEEAALIKQTTARKIFRLVENEMLHYDETSDHSLLVCLPSLSKITAENFLLTEKSKNQKEY